MSAQVKLEVTGDARLEWAARRVAQKMWSAEHESVKRSTTRSRPSLLAFITPDSLAAIGAAAVLCAAAVLLLSFTGRPWIVRGAWSIIIVSTVLGLLPLFGDLRSALRYSPQTPRDTFLSFFRAVTGGRAAVAFDHLLSSTDKSSVVRVVPNVPGMNPSEAHEVTFDSRAGFSTYWQTLFGQGRPVGWEDSHSVFTQPVRHLSVSNVKARRLSPTSATVSADIVVSHTPIWCYLSAFLGVLPAFVLVPKHRRRVRMRAAKVLVKNGASWQMLNGELVSAEDLASTRL